MSIPKNQKKPKQLGFQRINFPIKNLQLEGLQHEDLIKMVKETKKKLEVVKKEAEESAKLAKELAKKLEEQEEQNLIQDEIAQNGAGQLMMAQHDESLVEVFFVGYLHTFINLLNMGSPKFTCKMSEYGP
jgi:uncharacterized coiled-coil DUF342 family protein